MLQSYRKLSTLALVAASLATGCKAKAGEFCRSDGDCRDGLVCTASAHDGEGGECVANEADDGDAGTSGPPTFYDLASKRDLGPPDDSEDPDESGTGTGGSSDTSSDSATGDSSTGDSSTGDSSTGDSSTGDSSTGDPSTGESGVASLPSPG